MSDWDSPQSTFDVAGRLTGGTAFVAVVGGLLSLPEVRLACSGVIRDPEVHKACIDASKRVGLAVASSWRKHGKDVGPAIMRFLRSRWS